MNEPPHGSYQLRFRPLSRSGSPFVFPCDARGQVQLDALSDRARNNYLYARAMVGRELGPPAVERHSPELAGCWAVSAADVP
jgi:hypothetical protein